MKTNPPAGLAPGILPVLRTKAQAKAFYNRISSMYDLLADRNEAPMRKAALDLLGVAPGERVLEIGFGTGRALQEFARAVGSTGMVIGVDLSDRMLARAKNSLAAAGLLTRCELHCCDAARLSLPPQSLHVVFMSFTLELFDTPEIPQVLAECMRVLQPGGRIAVVGVSREGSGNLWRRIFEWMHVYLPKFVDCRPIYVRRALESAGFEIRNALSKRMWIPVEIILAVKP
jgi:demethylmenaquinone methyltransferase/2-methoxy-6-polyprenyl-1,4-benzoquinol methylase